LFDRRERETMARTTICRMTSPSCVVATSMTNGPSPPSRGLVAPRLRAEVSVEPVGVAGVRGFEGDPEGRDLQALGRLAPR
jgi:hypothetical protein